MACLEYPLTVHQMNIKRMQIYLFYYSGLFKKICIFICMRWKTVYARATPLVSITTAFIRRTYAPYN